MACTAAAIIANRYHSRKTALAILERRGVSVDSEDAAVPEVVKHLLPREMVCVVERIDIRNTPPDSEVLWAIAQLSEVRDVGFYKSHVGVDVSETLNKLPCLEELSFHSSMIDAGTFEKMRRSRKITSICLTFSNASDGDCHQLASFPSLSHVYLLGTRVSDAGLSSIANLPSLTHLGISPDFVTRQGLEKLCERHPRLVLQCYGPDDFGESWWAEFKKRHPLCTIHR